MADLIDADEAYQILNNLNPNTDRYSEEINVVMCIFIIQQTRINNVNKKVLHIIN